MRDLQFGEGTGRGRGGVGDDGTGIERFACLRVRVLDELADNVGSWLVYRGSYIAPNAQLSFQAYLMLWSVDRVQSKQSL